MPGTKEVRYDIVGAKFRGESLKDYGDKNKDVLVNLCAIMYRLDPVRFAALLNHGTFGRQAWMSDRPDHPTWPAKYAWPKMIPGTKFWLYTNLNVKAIRKRVEDLVGLMGLPSSDLVIEVQMRDRFGQSLGRY